MHPTAWQPPGTSERDLDIGAVVALEHTLRETALHYTDVVIACSLQAEDMVLLEATARLGLPFRPFVLDTRRLHAETLDYAEAVADHFGLRIAHVHPDAAALAAFEARHGTFAFYEGRDERTACCGLRKVQPLATVLAGCNAWITGQRREQSGTRTGLAVAEHDSIHAIDKLNPLAAWSEAAVWQYLRAHDVPIHPLYARGFASIGCEPCTRAIRAGEPVRAGRWWWEDAAGKECGLHVSNVGDPRA